VIDWKARDLDALARRFQGAKPFPWLVLDDLLPPALVQQAAHAFADEPLTQIEDEIYLHLRSADPPQQPALRAARDAIAGSAEAVARICGKPLQTGDGAAYAYLPGHYLLPHSDCRASDPRTVAYAYYLTAPTTGGELELFDCEAHEGRMVRTEPAKLIETRVNRLVLFEVTLLSLHQVREVVDGQRLSIAGWFRT
jgi:hypothetical protein